MKNFSTLAACFLFITTAACATRYAETESDEAVRATMSSQVEEPSTSCPAIQVPAAVDCVNGTWILGRNANGCGAFQCVQGTGPTTPSACPAIQVPAASDCQGGRWVSGKTPAGCDTFTCVECPVAVPPPADSCPPNSFLVARREANSCLPSYDCQACPAVMLPPRSDCDGTWVSQPDGRGCTNFVCAR